MFRRRLIKEQWRRIGGDQPCNKNELRRKGICFNCKEPWKPNHSCLSDTEEIIGVGQEDIPSDFQDDNSSLDESMASYEDIYWEHEQSCGVVEIRLDLYYSVYSEQLVDPMGDIQGDESPLMIQHEKHIVEHEEDDMHCMHDDNFVRSQLEDHVEPMREEDEKPYFGLAIDEEKTDPQTTIRVVLLSGPSCKEVLETNMIVLQEVSRLEECGASRQMREDILEIVVNPNFGPTH